MSVVHAFTSHPRDRHFIRFHCETFLKFCDAIVVAVDGGGVYADEIRAIDNRIFAISYHGNDDLPEHRTNERGMDYREAPIRQTALDGAMKMMPSLIVFADTDEVPTPDVVTWIREIEQRPQRAERWYAHWVNLWSDYGHTIGGESVWSFQSARGNKKCLVMQPGGVMKYQTMQHSGMEPGRIGGGSAPTGEGHHLIDAPKLLHMKYGSSVYASRPESRLACQSPDVMLAGGCVVAVPDAWLWAGMPT